MSTQLTYLIQLSMIACIAAYAAIYLLGIAHGTVKPVLATWLFFTIATALSFATDFSERGIDGLLSNSYNLVDSVASILIFAVVLFRKDIRKSFTAFEKGCVGAVLLVFAGWLLSGENVLTHLCLQLILVIAYLPTLAHLWSAKEATEPVTTWSLNLVAALFGMIEPVMARDPLPIVYGIRSVLSCTAVILLVLRARRRAKTVISA